MVKSVGHDAAQKILEVEFRDGSVHRYHGVTHDHHNDLMKAESIGKHFHKNIRGKFDHEPPPPATA
jgi:lysyl-tRNA synthetase class 2